jgi:DNA-binding IclR family transcriptional regulator
VGTLARGIDVLELFGRFGPLLSQKEISEELGLPMPTVHRLTALLTERGWLDRDPVTRQLRLGMEMARLVPAMLSGMRLPELARPHLARLASELQETVNVATLQGAEIIYLLSEPGNRLLTSTVVVGTRLPAHCTALGKCLLSGLPDEAVQALLGPEPYERRTANTLTTWTALAADLASAREAGVAVSDGELEVGLVSIAAPVRWIDGAGTAAINVSLPATRATAGFRRELVAALLQTATAIGAEMAPGGTR